MNEPKFRGYSKEHGQWFYGHGWFKIDWTEEYKREKGIEDQACLYTSSSPVDCELSSMGQFTGLHDRNGKEIYEGDIVEFDMEVNGFWQRYVADKIGFDEENAMFVLGDAPINHYRNFEIIGNTYEGDTHES